MSRLFRLALATVIGTLALLALGGIARLHPAGSGCGNDWPLCNGSLLPALEWASLVEYLHRGVALTVLALSAATALTAFTTREASPRLRLLAGAGFLSIVLQSVIGGFAARYGAPTNIAILHLTLAMFFFGCAVAILAIVAAGRGAPAWLASLGRWPSKDRDPVFARIALAGAALTLLLLLFGATTSSTGSLACATWPLCAESAGDGRMETVIHLGYRATALLGTLATGITAFAAWKRGATLLARRLAVFAIALVVLQSGLNAAGAGLGDPSWTSAPHLLIASLLWMAMLAVAFAAWGPRPAPTEARLAPAATADAGSATTANLPAAPATGPAGAMALAAPVGLEIDLSLSPLVRARAVFADYVALTKPGIMTLLLTTTLCAMLMAARGVPPFWLVLVTMIGGALASGGASVLNCYLDRDIDGQMSRTRNRAIVAGRVSPEAALTFGIVLSAASILLLGFFVNWTAAALALAGNLFYVLVYTKWLKRSTPYNIVIGGAAGAAPPLVGWAAVTGDLSPLAWGLFAIVFAWTPPHFWALALLKQGEYTRASVPMLPVVRGEAETRRQILIYTALLMAVCIGLTPFGLGWLYLVGALVLNGIFLGYAIWLYRKPSKRAARQMFFYSLWYLALIFAVAVVDRIILS
jgi:protoheme IX farnesyltransferase